MVMKNFMIFSKNYLLQSLCAALCFLALATACANGKSDLYGEWTLVSVKSAAGETLTADKPERTPKIKLEKDGKVSGFGGCNHYTGTFSTDNKKSLKFNPLAATKKMCLDANVEDAFFAAVAAIDGYKIADGKLILKKGGTETIVFKSSSEAACTKSEATCAKGKYCPYGEWTLVSVKSAAGETLKADTPEKTPTVKFEKDGKVSGFGGCNRYTGTFTTDVKASLKFASPLAATKKMCLGATIEDAYFAAIATVDGYKIDGDKLILTKGGQEVAVFNPSAAAACTDNAAACTHSQSCIHGEWTLVSVKSAAGETLTPDAPEKTPTVKLEADGKVSGFGGCNRYTGTFTTDDKASLKFSSPLAATRKMCPGANIEGAFFAAVAASDSYKIADGRLILKKGSEEVAALKPSKQ
ncbi:MAG: META domain-containing protein [Prevotellaceae bacterium]|jgi:heat shock protein HslJ|nr:META domain-containing protein [Prevotellaceae bacterium]